MNVDAKTLLGFASVASALMLAPTPGAASARHDTARKQVSAYNYLTGKVTSGSYGTILSNLRAALKRDFPEKADHIAIADMRLPLQEALKQAGQELGVSDDPNFKETAKSGLTQYQGGLSLPFFSSSGKYYCIALGGSPASEATNYSLLKRKFHEVSHCLDDDIERGAQYTDGIHDPDFGLRHTAAGDIRTESFAEISAVSMMIANGATNSHIIQIHYAGYSSRYGMKDNDFEKYQAYEGFKDISSMVPVTEAKQGLTFEGQISHLRQAFDLGKKIQAREGYSFKDTMARSAIDAVGYTALYREHFNSDKGKYVAWLSQHQKLQEAERTVLGVNYINHKISSPYPKWQTIDNAKNLAQLFVYKHDTPNDKALDVLIEPYRVIAFVYPRTLHLTSPIVEGLTTEMFTNLETNLNLAQQVAAGEIKLNSSGQNANPTRLLFVAIIGALAGGPIGGVAVEVIHENYLTSPKTSQSSRSDEAKRPVMATATVNGQKFVVR